MFRFRNECGDHLRIAHNPESKRGEHPVDYAHQIWLRIAGVVLSGDDCISKKGLQYGKDGIAEE